MLLSDSSHKSSSHQTQKNAVHFIPRSVHIAQKQQGSDTQSVTTTPSTQFKHSDQTNKHATKPGGSSTASRAISNGSEHGSTNSACVHDTTRYNKLSRSEHGSTNSVDDTSSRSTAAQRTTTNGSVKDAARTKCDRLQYNNPQISPALNGDQHRKKKKRQRPSREARKSITQHSTKTVPTATTSRWFHRRPRFSC